MTSRHHLVIHLKHLEDGKQIEGDVAVVDETNWDIAGENHYGASTWANKNLNGFVDSSRRVWVHENKGNPGTMVHEAVHKYSDRALIGYSQPLNEGATEYFTRLVCNGQGINIAGRTNYNNNRNTVEKLVTLVGEQVVAEAYFDGKVRALKKAYKDAKGDDAEWRKFIRATKNDEWATADTYL